MNYNEIMSAFSRYDNISGNKLFLSLHNLSKILYQTTTITLDLESVLKRYFNHPHSCQYSFCLSLEKGTFGKSTELFCKIEFKVHH